MLRNQSGQQITLYAWNSVTGLPVTGDAANITTYISHDNGSFVASTNAVAESDSSLAPGFYDVPLTVDETNSYKITVSASSTTIDVLVASVPAVIYTTSPQDDDDDVEPSESSAAGSIVSAAELPIANGVGTVGYQVFDNAGSPVSSRTTTGVISIFTGTAYGIYQSKITIPSGVSAGTIVWDDGSGNVVANSFSTEPENLAPFVTSAVLPIKNGVGIVGYLVTNEIGEVIIPRTTTGISRLWYQSDREYAVYQANPSLSGLAAGIVVWDDGSGNATHKPFFIDNAIGIYVSTLDYTWGGSMADSYISLTEAETCVAHYVLDSLDWAGASGQTKDMALRMATRQIDSLVYLGTRRIYTQTLKFPRWFNYPGRIDRTEDQVKADIQLATCIQAAYLVRQGGRDAHAENLNAGIRQSSESVGPIRDQFTYTGGGAPLPLCTDAIRIIGPYRGMRQIFRA